MTPTTAIQLTEEEQQLLRRIDFHPTLDLSYERRLEIFELAHDLTLSLLHRDAIPPMRWAYFTEPKYNIGLKQSREQVFEGNGTRGEEIFRHPHFLRYLWYFINGPRLHPKAIEGFRELVERWAPISSGDVLELCEFAKTTKRRLGLERRSAAKEFYKLALESDVGEPYARMIRDAVFRLR